VVRFEKQTGIIIFVFFLVGSAGIIIPRTHQLFLSLFPFALILSLFLILLYHKPRIDGLTLLSLLIIGVAGFFIEVAGIKTHFIFGNYSYGNSLGFKIFDTPVLIGVNWILLVYATGSVSARLSNNSLVTILTASLLMVLYDILLEQTAGHLDMWHWKSNIVPFRNYFSWFIIAVVFHSFLKWRGVKTNSPLAFPVLISQIVFFLILFLYYIII